MWELMEGIVLWKSGTGCPNDNGTVCGDGPCEGGETCSNCQSDCGSCGSGNTINVPADYPTIQAAVNVAQDGDTVLVSPGTYPWDVDISEDITLASFVHTTGDISYRDTTIIGGLLQALDTIPNKAEVIGFTFTKSDKKIIGTGNVDILYNKFTNGGDAIDLEGDRGPVVRTSLIKGNLFDLQNSGDDAIDLDDSIAAIIEDNIMLEAGDDGVEIRLHSHSGPMINIIIRNNVITGSSEDGIQIIEDGGTDTRTIWIENNLITGSSDAGIGLMDSGDTSEDFRASSITDRIYVTGNTIMNQNYGITGGDNMIVLNNIIKDSNSMGIKNIDGNSIVAYNLFHGNGNDNSGSTLGSNNQFNTNPQLDSNYELQAGSPAIDAGVASYTHGSENVLSIPPSDYNGAAPDLGAYER